MIFCAGKCGLRIDGKLVWFDTQAEAEKAEYELLWGPKIRAAKAAGKRMILPADVAEQATEDLRGSSNPRP